MKTIATLAASLILAACSSVPSDSTASSSAPAAGTGQATQAAQENGTVADSGPRKQVCKSDDTLGSRMKRPRCFDLPDGNEKAYRDDLLRDKMDELRQLNESTTIRGTEDIFGR